MAAPQGNQNARKAKDWEGALRRALAQYESAEANISKGQALSKIAEQVVLKALAGNVDAINEIANRLDGKPAQAITGEGGGPIELDTRINASGLTTDQLRALASIAVHGS